MPGQTVDSTITIEISASDNVGVGRVDLSIDGIPRDTLFEYPYLYNWDTTLETEDEDKNDCLRLAEILRICMKYRNDPALALVFDTIGDERRITSHLLDPGVVGGPIFEKTSGSILMSGTLFPPSMYSDILGLPENRADGVEYKSGFPPENRPILIASDVTSKFSERESSYSTIRDHISSVLEKTPGNVAIFAPSYVMMDRIDSDISYSFGKRIERESRGMPKNLVERMINSCLLYTSDAADE